MKRTTLQLLLPIARGTDTPLRAQLVRELRHAIQSGRLRPGTQLPATRAMAEELGVSRGLVVEAYDQLIAEGYLVAQHGSATRVAEIRHVESASRRAIRGDGATSPHVRYDFRPSVPDVSLFPTRAWQRALHQALANYRKALDYPDAQGMEATRVALAGYLNRSRATAAHAESIVMCTGFAQAVRLVCEALFARGVRQLGVEDPGHAEQCADIRATGLELVPLSVDENGVRLDDLSLSALRAVLVTPAHQYPTGAILSGERRLALLEWARRHGGIILEDDYDAEYRYDREPIGALQGMGPDHVVYFGSASKMPAPSLRQGWVVPPADLVEPIARAKLSADRGSPVLEQLALAAFIEAGELDRHLRKTRGIYRRRRDLLVAALDSEMPRLSLRGAAAGLHLMLTLPRDADEPRIVRVAAASGIRVYGAREFYLNPADAAPALLLGYGSLPEGDTTAAVKALARVVATQGGRTAVS